MKGLNLANTVFKISLAIPTKIQKIIVMILSLIFAPALYLGALSGIIFIYFYDRKEFNKMYNESGKI